MRLTHRLFALALVALTPAVAIEAYNEVSTRQAREAEVRDLAIRSALQAASELQQIIEGARQLLTAISQVGIGQDLSILHPVSVTSRSSSQMFLI